METETVALGHGINFGLFQLVTFGAAVLARRRLDLLLYRTGIGAKIRAVSDDVAAADLIGLSSARIYAVAMGISFVTIAIAAGFVSVWTNFDPSAGPTRLLIAFEVIVLGGLGSLWGSLAGGIVLGVAQIDRRPVRHRLADHGGPSRFPHSAGAAAAGLVSKILMIGSAPNLILNAVRAAFAASAVAMAAAPFLFSAIHVVLLTEFMSMLVLAIMWNLLAGYADIVTVGQHAFVGVGAYAFFGFAVLGNSIPISLFHWPASSRS